LKGSSCYLNHDPLKSHCVPLYYFNMSTPDKKAHLNWRYLLSDIKYLPSWLSDLILPTQTSIKFRFLIMVVLVLAWLYFTLHSFVSHLMSNPFNIGEWLINYEAGFVRRGLLGSFTLSISDFLSASPSFVAFVMQSSIAALALGLLHFFVTRSNTPLLLFICMLGPMGFTYFLTDHAVVGRKEIIFYCLSLLWILFISRHNQKDSVSALEWLYLVAFSGLFTFSILSHEGFIFFIPILIWITLVREKSSSSIHLGKAILRTFPFVVATVTTIPLLLGASNQSVGAGMCDALILRGADKSLCDGGINLASESGMDGLALMTNFSNLPGYILAYGPALIVLWLVLSIYSVRHQRKVSFLGRSVSTRLSLTLLFLCASPIFIISVDWGRYLSIFFSLTSLGLLHIYRQRSAALEEGKEPHNHGAKSTRRWRTWGITIIGVYYLFFGVSHIGGAYHPLLLSAYTQTLRLLERISSLSFFA